MDGPAPAKGVGPSTPVHCPKRESRDERSRAAAFKPAFLFKVKPARLKSASTNRPKSFSFNCWVWSSRKNRARVTHFSTSPIGASGMKDEGKCRAPDCTGGGPIGLDSLCCVRRLLPAGRLVFKRIGQAPIFAERGAQTGVGTERHRIAFHPYWFPSFKSLVGAGDFQPRLFRAAVVIHAGNPKHLYPLPRQLEVSGSRRCVALADTSSQPQRRS